MSRMWWACHWCDWYAPVTWRPRWWASHQFRQHLKREHPGIRYENRALYWWRR